MGSRPLIVSITPGTVVAGVLILTAFWVGYLLRDLLLVVATAVILASSIEPATRRMSRWGFPRVLAVVLLYLLTIGVIATFFYFFVPPLAHEASAFLGRLPMYLSAIGAPSLETLLGLEAGLPEASKFFEFQNILRSGSSGILSAASTLFGGLMSIVLIGVLSFYLAVQEQGIDDFLRIVTPVRKHEYILDLWRRAQRKIGRWLQGQLLLSLIVGIMIYIGLKILGVQYAFLLALTAAVLELIPMFGSILAAVPAVVLSFIDGGTSHALLVIVMYIVVNQIEGNIIYPLVVQKVVGVSPLIVILALIAGGTLAGFLGILIAVPMAAAVQEYVSDIQKGKQLLAYPDEEGVVSG